MRTLNSKLQLLILLTAFISHAIYAQNDIKTPQQAEAELKADLNILFGQLDLSKVTSGLLLDYAFEYTEVPLFNGVISEGNPVNLPTWSNIYKTVYSAKINNKINLTNPESVLLAIKNSAQTSSAVPLATMHYRYDRFNDNAVQNGWLSYTQGKLWEIPNQPSPYVQHGYKFFN